MGILFSWLLVAAGVTLVLGTDGRATLDQPLNLHSAGFVLIGAGLIWFVVSLVIAGARSDDEDYPRVMHIGDGRRDPGQRY